MDGVLDLNLIHLFTFYLAAAFTLSTVRRLRQYHDIAQLVLAAPNRWPRVMRQIKGHWIMFILGFFVPLFWLIGALLPARRRL